MDAVRINVQAHSITAAEDAWSSRRGMIEVKWHIEGGRRIFDPVRAPASVRIAGI